MDDNSKSYIANIAFSETKGGGMYAGFVRDWARITVKIGNRFMEIWDIRKTSIETIQKLYEAEEELSQAKRQKSKDIDYLRQICENARIRFWEAFQSPAEISLNEKPIRGGGSISRISHSL